MNASKLSIINYHSSYIRITTVFISILIIIYGCESDYYSINDFDNTNKMDIHVHLGHYKSAVAKQALIDNFSLLTINTDSRDVPDIYYQQDAAMVLKDKYPGRVHYLSTFGVDDWGKENWDKHWLRYLQQTFDEGAIGVKVWKNIGMKLRDKDSSFIMIDHPSFDPIFNYLEQNNIPVMAHIGEPKNCWLPIEEMTVQGDKNYFLNHPEYHMYLHPEYPSYEDQIKARDNLLEKHPDLILVGAHLASLEWNVDEIAQHLDTYPNLAVETAGRMSHLQYQSHKEYERVRDFMIKYQDRILYGTDLISREDENESDAMEYAHTRWLADWTYLTTDQVMSSHEFEGEFRGLKLPREVVDKIYYHNAIRWFKYPVETEVKSEKRTSYSNPVGDYIHMGDPFVMKHENTYYLYGTSGYNGFKCWSSYNLIDWKYEGHAYRETDKSWGESTYWAPEVIRYNDKFYMSFSCKGKNKANDNKMLLVLAQSDSPTGPFTDLYAPWFDNGYSCIDAHIFIDEDHSPYLYFDRVGYDGVWPDGYMYGLIYCLKLNESFQPEGDTVLCIQADQPWENPQSMHSRCNEGSFVIKHNDTYYMTYSANHYADPFYGIGYATSDSPLGPWIKSMKNPIVSMDSITGVYGPGHNSITTSPDGTELFMVYHAHESLKDKRRTVNIDRLQFDEDGNLRIIGPTRTQQPLPAGSY